MVTTQTDREVEEAAKVAEDGGARADARRWLLEVESGTLCTLSVKRELEGFPFGSVVPFALTAEGQPIIYVANMAAHTSNLRRDPRASLFVQQPDVDGDPQAGWRLTLMGRFERIVPASQGSGLESEDGVAIVDAAALEEIDARYRARVPQTEGYRTTHDFHYWRMSTVEKVRYIAGFGRITWLDGSVVKGDADEAGVEKVRAGAVAHMNEDHAHNLLEMCEGLYGLRPASARMSSLEQDGFFVRTEGPDRLLFFPFGRDVRGSDVRLAVIDVLKRARKRKAAA